MQSKIRGYKDLARICEIFPQGTLRQGKNMRRKICNLSTKDHHRIMTLVFNVITNTEFLQFTPIQKKKILTLMLSDRKFFELLSEKKSGLKLQRQSILTQKGSGLITGLISIAIPAIISLLAK